MSFAWGCREQEEGSLSNRNLTLSSTPLAQPYIAMDWEPEMKKRYYDEVEAEVNRNGTVGMGDLCSSYLNPLCILPLTSARSRAKRFRSRTGLVLAPAHFWERHGLRF